MEWSSQNIPQGGIFQPRTVQYSPETRDFLRLLLEESKLSAVQRKKINRSVEKGAPLPSFQEMHQPSPPRRNYKEVLIKRPGSSKRRSFNTIVSSGVYEREKFRPNPMKVDRDKAKKHLQDMMAYGQEVKTKPARVKKQPEETIVLNRYEQLQQEIAERQQWLKEMEDLGEGDKYRQVIHLQIEEKLREIEKMIANTPKELKAKLQK